MTSFGGGGGSGGRRLSFRSSRNDGAEVRTADEGNEIGGVLPVEPPTSIGISTKLLLSLLMIPGDGTGVERDRKQTRIATITA